MPLPWTGEWPTTKYWADIVRDLLHGEMAAVHAPWYADYADRYRPRTRDAVDLGLAVTDDRLFECRTARASLKAALVDLADASAVDCWIRPSAGSVAPIGDASGDGWMTMFWSLAGLPAVSLPVFDGVDGLPHGLQVIAPLGEDEQLLASAGRFAGALAAASR